MQSPTTLARRLWRSLLRQKSAKVSLTQAWKQARGETGGDLLPADRQAVFDAFVQRSTVKNVATAKPVRVYRRRVLATASLLACLIVACRIPTSYDVIAGYRLTAHLRGQASEVAAHSMPQLEATLEEQIGLQHIAVLLRVDDRLQETALEISMWGTQQQQVEASVENLRTRFVWLHDAKIEYVPVSARYDGTVASRLRHEFGWITPSELDMLTENFRRYEIQGPPHGEVQASQTQDGAGKQGPRRIRKKIRLELRDEKAESSPSR